jgi:hypothetical protein
MIMRKSALITCEEIEKDKIYLANVNGISTPAKVVCTEEPGYLRGHVMLDDFKTRGVFYVAMASIELVPSGRILQVCVSRQDNGWEFTTNPFRFEPTLIAVTEEWKDQRQAQLLEMERQLWQQLQSVRIQLDALDRL